MATVYQYFGPTQPNGYHQNNHEPPPQHFEYPQPHPMLPGLNGSYNPRQKRISYMSRDQARQHQSFSVQAEPMPIPFIQQFVSNPAPIIPPHQIPPAHLIDAEKYQQNAEARKEKQQQQKQKRKSNINQALPRPSYNQPKSRESTPKRGASHHHKISNQEPITQFQEINTLKQRDKTKHHQIGSALPSNSNIYSKETHSVASTRNPSFVLQHVTTIPNVADNEDGLEDIQDIDTEDIQDIREDVLDDDDMSPPQPILQHNNTRITHKTELTGMTALTDLTDMTIIDHDEDDEDDDDDATAINLNVPSQHVASLSTELKSFQDGLRMNANLAAATLKSTKTMPKSSLALMNTGMVDKDGNLSKQSILLINRVRDTSFGGKLHKILSVEEDEEEANETVSHHKATKSMSSDVSGMSSISSYHPKFKYNNNHRPYQSRRGHNQSVYSVASTDILTPTPGSTRTPNNPKKFDFREDTENDKPDSIHVKTTSNEAHPTMNRIQQPELIGLDSVDSPATSMSTSMKSIHTESSHQTQPTDTIGNGTPIAYSSVNQHTGQPKCLYRFVLSDRDKEIAIGDIVKAPIPKQMGNINKMKFNGIIHKKEEQSDDVQVITNNKFTSHYVGIVRYLGTTTFIENDIEKQIVTYLGLELMDPIGDCDGRLFDGDSGDYIRHFQTQPNYAVFVSVGDVVKIPPSTLLSTLTDAIQKLNKHIVSLSKDSYMRVQQIDEQQQHIAELYEKNKHLTKLAATQLEKINDIKASNVSVMASETAQNLPMSPDVSFTSQTNSYPLNSLPSSQSPTPRRKNDKNGIKTNEQDANTGLGAPPGHHLQSSFASGYGISGPIQQFQHVHNLSMMSGISNFAVHPERGIPQITSNIEPIQTSNAMDSPKLGHQPTPEIHRINDPANFQHHPVTSNMSELELQTQLLQSYAVSNNNLQAPNLPNTHNAILLSNASYAPMITRVGPNGALHLSPQNSHHSQPVTPPQPVLHQVTLSPGVPPGYMTQVTQPNMIASQQYIMMDQHNAQNNTHTQYLPTAVNPTSLKQIGIASIPASPPKIKEITPTPSPQPPTQNSILPPQPMDNAPEIHTVTVTEPPPHQHTFVIPYSKGNIADIVLSSSPNQNAVDHEVNQGKQSPADGTQKPVIKLIGKRQLKGVIKRKSQEAALREHLAAVNRERLQLESLQDMRSDSMENTTTREDSLNDLDRIVLQPSNSEDVSNSENEHGHVLPMQRADSSEMTEIVLTKGHKPKRRRRSSVLSSHANPPPDQKQTIPDIDGYNAEDESAPHESPIPITQNNYYDYSPVPDIDNTLSIRSLQLDRSAASADLDTTPMDAPQNTRNEADSSSEDGLGKKTRSKHSYRESYEIAANKESPSVTPPYRIQVTPPANLNEDLISLNMQMAPNYVAPVQIRRELSNPILCSDSEHETNSVQVESGDHSPIPDSMQGTPKPTTPYTPYTPYTEGEEEAKQSQPMTQQTFQSMTEHHRRDMNHFDEENDDDSKRSSTSKRDLDADKHDTNDEKSNNSPQPKKKKKLGRKKTLTKRPTQNYDHTDPYRAPWEKSEKDGYTSPVSVNHGTGYDVHLVAKNTDAKGSESDGNSMSLSLSEDSDDEQESKDSSNPTDHECDACSESSTEDEAEKTEENQLEDTEENQNDLGLLVRLGSLNCSDPIIESHDEEELEEDDAEDDTEIPLLEHKTDKIVNVSTEEQQNAGFELVLSPRSSDEKETQEQTPILEDFDTGEIALQSYGIGAPPSRHERADTLHIHHKKRGTLSDLSPAVSPMPEEDQHKDKDGEFETLNRDNQGSNDDTVHLTVDDDDDDGLSEMETPQPDIVEAPPTRFTFSEEINKNKDNDETDAIGDLEITNMKEKYDSGKVTNTTPISKQNYGVAAPPTKHNRDHSTVHDRMRLNVLELNALLRNQQPDNDDENDEKPKEAVENDDNGSRGSVEYSSEETIEELMNIDDLHRLEASDSQRQLPHTLHLQMSTATREYVHDLGLSVMDNMDAMDFSDDDQDPEQALQLINEQNSNDQQLLELGLMATSASSSASLPLPDPSAENSGSPTDSSVTPSPKQKSMQIPVPNPELFINHSVESIGSVASDKGPIRQPIQHNKTSHGATRSMGSLDIVNINDLDFEMNQNQLNLPASPDKSEDNDSAESQGSMVIHDQIDHRESVINSSMDLGEDILDGLYDDEEPTEEHHEDEDAVMTDEDGTDIHKKKGYTKKMKKFVPIINTQNAQNVESFEIVKQIENFRKEKRSAPNSPKRKRRKSKKGHRLHQKSPKKVYSPHIEHMYHHSGHSPYDQHIFRPELDLNTQSSRNYSVKSKRSNRSSSSSSSQRRGSKRNSKSSKRNSKEYERRKSKSKQKRSKKRKSKRRHKKQHSRESSSTHSDDEVNEANDEEAQNINNTNPMFYPQQFYPQIINQQQHGHFQSHSLSHLQQQQFMQQQFMQQQNGINYNHGSSVSQGAMDFAIQPNMFQPHQQQQQQQQIYHHQYHSNSGNSQQWQQQ